MNDTSTAAAPSAPTSSVPSVSYPTSQPSSDYYNYGTSTVPGYNQHYYNGSSYNNNPPGPVTIAVTVILLVVIYVYLGIVLHKLAKKTATAHPGLAWIPIVNIYTFVKIAGKPWWWILLLCIPLVNIVIVIILWMQISRRVNKPDYLGILMIIPLVNIIIPAYLAFSDSSAIGNNTPTAPMVPPATPPSSPAGM